MKKTNKILGGLFAVLLVGTFAVRNVKAETLDDLGSEGKDATIQTVYEPEIYNIDIKWGSMKYTYYRVSEGNYGWHGYGDGYTLGNYVEVTNNSTNDIKATLSWESAITGVTASFDHSERIQGNGTCVDAIGAIATTEAWSDQGMQGEYRMSPDRELIIYTDNTCQTYVTPGTLYNEQTTYYTVALDSTDITHGNNVTVPAPILSENAPFTVAGFYNQGNGRSLSTTTHFSIELSGGSETDVKAAYNTEAKKIGTVTVTITDAD